MVPLARSEAQQHTIMIAEDGRYACRKKLRNVFCIKRGLSCTRKTCMMVAIKLRNLELAGRSHALVMLLV